MRTKRLHRAILDYVREVVQATQVAEQSEAGRFKVILYRRDGARASMHEPALRALSRLSVNLTQDAERDLLVSEPRPGRPGHVLYHLAQAQAEEQIYTALHDLVEKS